MRTTSWLALLLAGVLEIAWALMLKVWTGIGAAGTTVVGIAIFGEPADALRVACLGLIIVGIVGLKFFSPA